MNKLTLEERTVKVKMLLKNVECIKSEVARIGLEYFILKAIDDEFELEILDNTITALRSD
jgi:hypothetical protein